MTTTKKPAVWKNLARCLECGVDARKACRDDDDLPAWEPCKGRKMLPPAPPSTKAKLTVKVKQGPPVIIAIDREYDDASALDRIALLLRIHPLSTQRSLASAMRDIFDVVTLTGRELPQRGLQ